MRKIDLPLPLLALGLALAFVFVSSMVILTRSHPAWIRRKLRVGAMLLTLTATASCGGQDTMCYAAVAPNQIEVGQQFGGTITVNLAETRTLSGTIHDREGQAFSYRITSSDGDEIVRANLTALDGAFDEGTEEFEIVLPSDIAVGTYLLEVFAYDADAQPDYASGEFTLEVIDE